MNIPTIIVSLMIAVIFIAIVVNEVKKRKNGHGCSCSCGSCSMQGICHGTQEKEE